MLEWLTTTADTYSLAANTIIFILVASVLLVIRRLLLKRIYNRLQNTSNWYVTRKVAKWINNLMLAILFL
jgi:Na+/H+ antiporter NhaA